MHSLIIWLSGVDHTNKELIDVTITGIFKVAARRTLDSYIVKILANTLQRLQTDYPFLKTIALTNKVYAEDTELVSVDPHVNTVDKQVVGNALEAFIRKVCEQIDQDTLLYFIQEFNDTIGESYVQTLIQIGVNLKEIQAEHHALFADQPQKQPKPKTPPSTPEPPQRKIRQEAEEEGRFLEYTWRDVSQWKYEENVCMLYDTDGSLLDTLHLDELVEDYVSRYTKYEEPETPPTTLLDITKKEYEFLETLYTRDMDMELAMGLLNIPKRELESMVNKFLEMDLLQRVTESEVKLTQKGILCLMQKYEDNH